MSFAPLQLIQTATNKDVWGLCDDHHDKYLSVQVYFGAVSTKPMDAELFGIGCLMVHRAERNVYINIATDGAVPNWLLVGGTSVPIFPFLLAKGDLLTHNGITTTILSAPNVGGWKLTSNPSAPNGIEWLPDSTTPPTVGPTSTATSGNTQVSMLSWAHTSIGSNRLLVVQISTEQFRTVNSVTFNGIPLTQAVQIANAGTNVRSEQWYLVAPPVGTYNIVVTLSGAAYLTCGAETVSGVDQSAPIGAISSAFGNSTAPSTTNNTVSDFSLVLDGLCTVSPAGSYTIGADQTLNWQELAATRQGASSAQAAGTAPDSVVMSWTLGSSTPWAISSLEVRGIAPTSVSSAVSASIFQSGHGFVDGDIVHMTAGGLYQKAQADAAANAEVTGYVNQVLDVDNFILITEGFVTGGVPASTPGTIWFLSTSTAGALQNTEPVATNNVSKPLLEIISSGAYGYFHNYRGKIIGGGGSGGAGAAPFSVNQVGHGFAIGDIIRPDTNQWAASQAVKASASDLSAEAWAQVTIVTDADNFTAQPLDGGTRQQDATIVGLISGFTGGSPVFLDATTPGAFTDVEPSALGTVSKPIGYVEANAAGTPISLLTLNYRGLENISSSGGGIIVTDVTIFEDFLNYSIEKEGGTGTDTVSNRFLYASIIADTGQSPQFTWHTDIPDHPGVVSTNDVNDHTTISMFGAAEPNGTGALGSIPLENDFTLEVLTKCIYNTSVDPHNAQYVLDDVSVMLNAESGVNALTYSLFGVTGSTTIPASDTWFKIGLVYAAGTITLKINGATVASQAGSFANPGNGRFESFIDKAGGGTIELFVDYGLLNYTLTR